MVQWFYKQVTRGAISMNVWCYSVTANVFLCVKSSVSCCHQWLWLLRVVNIFHCSLSNESLPRRIIKNRFPILEGLVILRGKTTTQALFRLNICLWTSVVIVLRNFHSFHHFSKGALWDLTLSFLLIWTRIEHRNWWKCAPLTFVFAYSI